jgi:hypothetical protein
VGNADVSNVLPLGERHVCMMRERGEKDLSKDAGVLV